MYLGPLTLGPPPFFLFPSFPLSTSTVFALGANTVASDLTEAQSLLVENYPMNSNADPHGSSFNIWKPSGLKTFFLVENV